MAERRALSVSLVGHVVADLSLRPLEPGSYRVGIRGLTPHRQRPPQYKADGFFAVADLPDGDHTVEIIAPRYQPETLTVTLPLPPEPVVEPLAGNEFLVRLMAVEPPTPEMPGRILFAPVDLPLAIGAGAAVRAAGFETTLAEPLEAGAAMAARVVAVGSLAAGDLVRIVRQRSIRLRHDPYSTAAAGLTRVGGRVTENPEGGLLEGASIRLVEVNGQPVEAVDVAGTAAAQVTLDGQAQLLGFERDLATLSNERGDYQLYFPLSNFFEQVTVEISATGFLTTQRTIAVTPGERTSVSVGLDRS